MRKDGIRVKKVDLEYGIMPYFMPHRYDSMNMITLDIAIEGMQKFRAEARRNGHLISHMGVILAAWLRTAREFPLLNRFIVNKRIYDRNEFSVGMVVLKSGGNEGTMSKIYFDPSDTVYDVERRIDAYVEKNRSSDTTNSTDKVAGFLMNFPGLANFGVGFLRFLDRYGLLPKSIIDASPFHNSMCISNLASIRTNHIYHHCYEFGTTSLFITMGNLREVAFHEKGNSITFKRCIPLGVVMDERICSGHYFAQAFERMKQYLENPYLLTEAPSI